jgi:hypothetical protein
LVEIMPTFFVSTTLDIDQRLKRFQCLHCSFEADCTWLYVMLICHLCDDRSDEIVGQNVRPNLLSH